MLCHISDSQTKCIRGMITGDFSAAQKYGCLLYEKHPQYLQLCYYLNQPSCSQLLLLLLKKAGSIDLSLLHMLIKEDAFSYAELDGLAARADGESFMHLIIRREMLIRKWKEAFDASAARGCVANNSDGENMANSIGGSSDNAKGTKEEAASIGEEFTIEQRADELDGSSYTASSLQYKKEASDEVNRLLDQLDDFQLYDFAMQYGLEISPRPSANYKWYCAICFGDKEAAAGLIRKSLAFDDIARLCQATGLAETGQENLDILVAYLSSGYSEALLARMAKVFSVDKSFMSCKIILALLIASREENNLVLAYYISYMHSFSDNYEIDLIHLFLNRFFCFNSNIYRVMKSLDIKNIQVYNMAYVWSDPLIVTGVEFSTSAVLLARHQKDDLATADNKLRALLDIGRVGQAAALFRVRAALQDSLALREISERRILAEQGETIFSGLLGEPCRYLFDKLTVGHARRGSSVLGSLFAHRAGGATDSVLKNRYMEIDNQAFLRHFQIITSKPCK